MLSQAENDFLTRVGPDQPAGQLLRRYWMPVGFVDELTHEQPTKFVRLLCEDLVLFLDKQGRVGLLADHCAHRGASLCYGRVEERGISCAYHGWLYDTGGNILETPPERNDAIMRSVKQTAYPVRRYLGMYWAYLGPAPAPEIPPYDVFVRKDGHRKIVVHPRLDCNWFQAMENSVDPAHLQILHQEFIGQGKKPVNTTRGFTDDVVKTEFRTEWFGIIKHREYANGKKDEHPLIFPNILRQGPNIQIRVPVDDTHTNHIDVNFEPTPDHSLIEDQGDPPVTYRRPYRIPPDKLHPEATYDLYEVRAQDHMAWETQGPIADRTAEHLSYSDRGVHILRKIMRDEIEKVLNGQDPMGLVRDPSLTMIDTNLYGEAQGVGVRSEHHPAGINVETVPA